LDILTENHTHTKYIDRHCVTKDLPVYTRPNNTTAHCTCNTWKERICPLHCRQ